MRKDYISILLGICASMPAMASNEGAPAYYQKQTTNMNRAAYPEYKNRGYTDYVGQSGPKQVIATSSRTYQVPRPVQPEISYTGTTTKNGIARPASDDNGFSIYGGYSRRFADFQFTTSVNSILEWDDMIFNELTAGARYNFSLRNFDMLLFGEYTYGNMASAGLSMDYDLKPYDENLLNEGIFTVSVGEQSGDTHRMRFGFGAHNIWDIGGWKFSPIFGYEIFKHNLQMNDHYYPNPGVYIPLMTADGDYVFADETAGVYFPVPLAQAQDYADSGYYQVCVSPAEIKVASVDASGGLMMNDLTEPADPNSTVPWGVTYDECIVIGGDGPIVIPGKTHEYNTTWSGFFIGLEIEKQMTWNDKLRLYGQIGLPKYSSEGIWPNRTDWQQNPSFLDEGDASALTYSLEMEYELKLSDRLQLSLRADTNYFHVGKIGGEIYWAPYTEYSYATNADGDIDIIATTYPAYTEHVSDALKEATWQSFGLRLGLKCSF